MKKIAWLLVLFTPVFWLGTGFSVDYIPAELVNVEYKNYDEEIFDNFDWSNSIIGYNGYNADYEIYFDIPAIQYESLSSADSVYFRYRVEHKGQVETYYIFKTDFEYDIQSGRYVFIGYENFTSAFKNLRNRVFFSREYFEDFNISYVELVFFIPVDHPNRVEISNYAFVYDYYFEITTVELKSYYFSNMYYKLDDFNQDISKKIYINDNAFHINNVEFIGHPVKHKYLDIPDRIGVVENITFRQGIANGFLPVNTNNYLFRIKDGSFNMFSTYVVDTLPPSENDSGGLLLPLPNYSSCAALDLFCHMTNAVVWLVRDFPPIAILYNGANILISTLWNTVISIVSIFGFEISGSGFASRYGGIVGTILVVPFIFVMWKVIKLFGRLF